MCGLEDEWRYEDCGFADVFAVCLLRLQLLDHGETGWILDLGEQIDAKELMVVLLVVLVRQIRLTAEILCGDDLVAVARYDLPVGFEGILFDS